MIPFVGNHSSMVIGSKGKCIRSLQQEFGVTICAMKADPSKNLPVPYFSIIGDERSVLFAALKVHSLLSLSMGRSEKKLKAENEQLTKDKNEALDLAGWAALQPSLPIPPSPPAVSTYRATAAPSSPEEMVSSGKIAGFDRPMPGNEYEWEEWADAMLKNEEEEEDPCINEMGVHCCCVCCTTGCCRCDRYK